MGARGWGLEGSGAAGAASARLHGLAGAEGAEVPPVVEDGGLDVTVGQIHPPPVVDMGLARVYQSRQPLGGGRVDAPPKPLGLLGIAAVESQQLCLEQLQELVGHGVVHQAKVRTDTCLA